MAYNKNNNAGEPPLPTGEGRGEGWHRPTTIKARDLRKDPTEAEKALWQKIRDRQLNGFKFKRQYPIGNYVADFICSELFLVLEVDGGQHNESEKDKVRTAFLESKGYEVVRFWNNDVLENIDGVVQSLTRPLSRREREISPYTEKALFLAQCTAGLQEVVAGQLVQDFEATIEHTEEGLVVFYGSGIEAKKLSYTNNVFLVLQQLNNADMNTLLSACTQGKRWHQPAKKSINKGERSFRLFLSDESRLVAADRVKLDKLIGQIEQQCRIAHTAHRPDTEFWLFRRRNGAAYFCKRLTKNRMTEKNLDPGELRPELARTLCLISEPAAKDIFLDPFAGSGAIAFARKDWPYEMIFISDIEPEKVQAIKKNIPKTKKPIITRAADALKLDKIEDGFIDKVVTDPPWGLFDKSIKDVPAFYKNTLKEMCRVVKPGGLIVMLTGARELIADLSQHFSNELTLEHRYDILVSGKKASIAKWRRINGPQ